MWKTSSNQPKGTKKEVRKPISTNFSPKRLAINFQPPTLVLEYLVIDTGKLYHHKMRLDSIMRKPHVSRNNVMNYVKTKHHLYFLQTKIKDQQILKIIDRILQKHGKGKAGLQKIEQRSKHLETSPSAQIHHQAKQYVQEQQNDDFDYLNDDDQYDQDYQDYEDEQNHQAEIKQNKQNNISTTKVPTTSSFTTKTLQKAAVSPPQQNKNTFMTYCQEEYEDQNQQEEGQANWDLDIEENGDFDFV